MEQEERTDPSSYRFESNGSGVHCRNKPRLVKYSVDILKKKVRVVNKLAAGFLFLLMPFNSQNSSVICFHIVKEGPSGRTEGVASPTFLPLPKGSGIRRYLWDPAPLASPLCRTISALSVKTF